jgi:hypothetical protein
MVENLKPGMRYFNRNWKNIYFFNIQPKETATGMKIKLMSIEVEGIGIAQSV